MRAAIYLEIVPMPGASITDDAIPEMVALAKRVLIPVHARLNGIMTRARPDDDAGDLVDAWNDAAARKASVAATPAT